MYLVRSIFFCVSVFFSVNHAASQSSDFFRQLQHSAESAKPWVFWFWMHAAVSKEGITADLEAMKRVGLGGAYLMPIYDTTSKIPFDKPVRQNTPEWWAMVNHAMLESKRLGLKLGMHVSDGFALAGGPWISADQSMQKLVWSRTFISGSSRKDAFKLDKPETIKNYYKDIAVYAYPVPPTYRLSKQQQPKVSSSIGTDASFLIDTSNKSQVFRSENDCWIQFNYEQEFTLRSLKVKSVGNNYPSQRLIVQKSDDGLVFENIIKLTAPRHGWQDSDEDHSFSIPATHAKYFRLVYEKQGAEPGSEDLDAAKWKPVVKLKGSYLSSEPVINQIEAKNGSVWRIGLKTTNDLVDDSDAVPLHKVINLTEHLDKEGVLHWDPPMGDWIVIRVGHTSTGHTNYTGGAALGLECDKFDSSTVKLQFREWFGKAFEMTDPGLAKQVLRVLHVDSWEAGSQNWSRNFPWEFKRRRGYDLMPYLLVMTGVPIESSSFSEKVLHDVRQTIAELVNDVFYKTLKQAADEKGVQLSAESVAPTMLSDNLLHYKTVDLPMGEFWYNSPTHDKPNDMLDAISAAHIYGKNIIQAEAFTTLRMNWSEHPGQLKTLADRSFAAGINKMILHVFVHNPWLDRKPGMSLNSVGLFYQRNQTWFEQSKFWIDYLTNVSVLLQQGKPVVDIAVFTGEELPRRALTPDRLISSLPGLFGKKMLESESQRVDNNGQPTIAIPNLVAYTANTYQSKDWMDPLRGYKYDCLNPDALMTAFVSNGNVVLASGMSYRILVIPGNTVMNPDSKAMSLKVVQKLLQLKQAGATIFVDNKEAVSNNLNDDDSVVNNAWNDLISNKDNGRVVMLPFLSESLEPLNVKRDLEIESAGAQVAWTHRHTVDSDIYFIANQKSKAEDINIVFRSSKVRPIIWDPLTGNRESVHNEFTSDGRTRVVLPFEANGSIFVIFSKENVGEPTLVQKRNESVLADISNNWKVHFDTASGGPQESILFPTLTSWSDCHLDGIKYYSGTATYTRNFELRADLKGKIKLGIDSLYNLATIFVNGIDCGTVWTYPYEVDISKAIKKGNNNIEIKVTNTWANRLSGDQLLKQTQSSTWTTAQRPITGALLRSGLIGSLKLVVER